MKSSVFPFIFQNKLSLVFDILSKFENNLIEKKNIIITDPVFVTGCPRSGTTILTEILNETNYFGSYLYKDLPYYKIPIIWNYIRDKMLESNVDKIRRIHGDNIFYNYNSPDSFEEIIWSNNLPNYNDMIGSFIEDNYENKRLLSELENSIKKILFLRNSKRYLSKGNYNLFRLKYLMKNFKNAKFIIVIRDPYQTSLSSENVHKIFLLESKKDNNFDKALEFLCHFEFGNKRKVLNICSDKKTIKVLWKKGKEFEGYLYQWMNIYNFVLNNYLNDELKKNLFIFNYEKFKENKESVLKKLFKFLNINLDISFLNLNNIKFKNNIKIEKNVDHELIVKVDKIYNEITKIAD